MCWRVDFWSLPRMMDPSAMFADCCHVNRHLLRMSIQRLCVSKKSVPNKLRAVDGLDHDLRLELNENTSSCC